MKTIITFIFASLFIVSSCKKNNTPPAAPQQQNNVQAVSSLTLTGMEAQLAGKWYYQTSQVISNDSIVSNFTYSTTPALNSIEFKCTLCSASSASGTATPDYKDLEKVTNGAINSTMVWKVNAVGILSMNLYGADPKCIIDSISATRLVYTQYTSLQPLNGTRYHLYK